MIGLLSSSGLARCSTIIGTGTALFAASMPASSALMYSISNSLFFTFHPFHKYGHVSARLAKDFHTICEIADSTWAPIHLSIALSTRLKLDTWIEHVQPLLSMYSKTSTIAPFK